MKIALAHDYLTQRGGAERVTLQLGRLFDHAPIFTSVYSPRSTFAEFSERDIRTSWLQRVPILRSDPRLAVPLLPRAWSGLVASDVDVVLCSSTGWSHGISVNDGTRKVVYCHNPARWLYQSEEYANTKVQRAVLRMMRPQLIEWDQQAASTADVYIANSRTVADRIWETYGIRADVIHPPMMLHTEGPQQPIYGIDGGFWLTIARGRSYKNIRVIAEAVSRMPGHQLVVAGTSEVGPSTEHQNVQYAGFVSEPELRWLYSNALALVSVAHEDFGLTPIEANAFGTPAAVLRSGGFLETVVDGINGKMIDAPAPDAVADTLSNLPTFDPTSLRGYAKRFSVESFCDQISAVVDASIAGGQAKGGE